MTQDRSKWFDEEAWRRPDHWSNAQLGGFPLIPLLLIVAIVSGILGARYEPAKVKAKAKGDSTGCLFMLRDDWDIWTGDPTTLEYIRRMRGYCEYVRIRRPNGEVFRVEGL